MYNPFVTSETYLANMLYNINYINKSDIIGSKLSNRPLDEVRNILFYSSTNKNKADIIKNLNNNIEKYIALQFIIIMIRDKLDNVLYKNDNEKYIKIHLDILDSLITKNIVNGLSDNDHSKSISDSISWYGTPRSSSSDHSHFQSNANIERYKKTKADLVAEITQNNINDMDPYLAERWEDMPLEKLRNVISIKHTEGTNTYGVAFYIRTLYQAWRNSVIYNKPFKNPYTRKEFTDNDKYDIMDAMEILYPNITLPKYNGRNDIILETTNNYINGNIYIKYIFKYKLNAGIENDRILINILSFSIPLQFNVDIEPDYIQHYLFENISYLLKKNKLFGKGIPLKIIPSIHLPLGRSFTISRNNYAEY